MIDDMETDICLALTMTLQPLPNSTSKQAKPCGSHLMEIRFMEELVEVCEREQKTIGEVMLMMEAKNRGKMKKLFSI